MTLHRRFDAIWFFDFEFSIVDGGFPSPVCLVAIEYFSGRTIRLFSDEMIPGAAPFQVDESTLFVGYFTSADFGCFLQLDWQIPLYVLDLYTEFSNTTNGLILPHGRGLIGALIYYGLPSLAAVEKEEMRQLAMRGGPYSVQEKQGLLSYCETDVIACRRLFESMEIAAMNDEELCRAMIRGKYMSTAAKMEKNGIAVDNGLLEGLRRNWQEIQTRLISKVDRQYGVFSGRTFRQSNFREFLNRQSIPWPCLPSGALDLSRDTFRLMSQIYPCLRLLYELRENLSQLKEIKIPIGPDGRSRSLISPFKSRTGRNQPPSSKYVYAMASWLRALIKPQPGYAIAYIDWSQQEHGIAGALSGDSAMWAAYDSGDPYLSFAIQAGLAPEGATKISHPAIRGQAKECVLATQYGQSAQGLALRINSSIHRAQMLLDLHRKTYHVFWGWIESITNSFQLTGKITTTYGWRLHLSRDVNLRMVQNFPMQANGAEMLRLACIFADEAGIKICAPVHDAILIEAPEPEIEEHIHRAQAAMKRASEIVLGGYALRSDAEIVRYPDRVTSEKGEKMWRLVEEELLAIEKGA